MSRDKVHSVDPAGPALRIRYRQRFQWSPPKGHRQDASEWQVTQGRKIVGRFDLEQQAKNFRDFMRGIQQ